MRAGTVEGGELANVWAALVCAGAAAPRTGPAEGRMPGRGAASRIRRRAEGAPWKK